jgi:hypothetical protein
MRTNSVETVFDASGNAPKRPGLHQVTLNTNLIANDRLAVARYFLASEYRHIMVLCQLDGLAPCSEISPATMPEAKTTNRQIQRFGHDSPPRYLDIPDNSYNPSADKTYYHPPDTNRPYA